MEFDYPTDLTQQQAMIRRADKLAGILIRDYSSYTDEQSIERLSKFIKLTIWALENALEQQQWKPFLDKLTDLQTQILDVFQTEEAAAINYTEVVASLLSTLEEYKSVISQQHENG